MCRSDIPAPLTELCGKNSEWAWTETHQKAFETIEQVMARESALAHPNFNKPFEIHTDASEHQLGAIVSQNGRPLAFHSRELNSAQRNCTATEHELLATVETLKEFRNILLGHEVTVHTDHKNLTCEVFNAA